MRKSMQQLTDEYAKKYLPNNDKMHCLEYYELLEMAKAAAEEDKTTGDYAFYLVKFAFDAGFMKGYHCAEYDRKKKAKK